MRRLNRALATIVLGGALLLVSACGSAVGPDPSVMTTSGYLGPGAKAGVWTLFSSRADATVASPHIAAYLKAGTVTAKTLTGIEGRDITVTGHIVREATEATPAILTVDSVVRVEPK